MPLVPDMHGRRAFDKQAGKVVALAAGLPFAAGLLCATPAQALPHECAALTPFHMAALPHVAYHAPHFRRFAPASRRHHHHHHAGRRWARRASQSRPYARRMVARSAARRWQKVADAARVRPARAVFVGCGTLTAAFPFQKPVVRVAGAQELRVAPQFKAAKRVGSANDVTLDFVAADINDVLKALAVQTRSNVVSGNDVKGNVTVSLSHVTLDEALDMISKLSGYQYARVGRTYVVGSPASIATLAQSGVARAPAVTAVLAFNYADPTDLGATIHDRYPNVKATPGKAAGGSGAGGVLVVTGTESDVDSVRRLVADQEAALSKGIAASKTEVYNIKYAAADDLQSVLTRLVPGLVVTPGPSMGFNLKAPTTADASGTTTTTATYGTPAAGATSVTGTGNLPVKPTTSSLLLTGSDGDIARARTILAQVDLKPAQINFEAKVTEVNRNSAKQLGLKYDFSQAATRIGEKTDNLGGGKPTLGDNGFNGARRIFNFGTLSRTAISGLVNVSLDAMINNGDAKLLSDPNISAVDGQPAAVFIGDTIRYVSSITQTPTGQTVTTSSVDVGIKLFVTGKVSDDGYVTVNLHPEVSLIRGYLNVPGGGQLPQVSTREATTTVRVKDGDTIAIGGLISDQDIKNVQKVPFLGDLPFIGNLFRDVNHTSNRNEVVIFVKVSVQKDAA